MSLPQDPAGFAEALAVFWSTARKTEALRQPHISRFSAVLSKNNLMRIFLLGALLGCLFVSCRSVPEREAIFPAPEENGPPENVFPETAEVLPVSPFREIWGYVVAGRENALNVNMPVTDVGYFGAELDSYGRLGGVPSRRLLAAFRGKVHLVVASNSRSLTHFALESGSRTRNRLVADLLEASRNFDGLQIDFEYVPSRDGEHFRSFLGELRRGLGGKILSIALPARTRAIENDVYDYAKILPLVDRILVMAYDEHWSGSRPGPIASLEWCKNIARYSLSTVGAEKLIMGIPFYGRTWGSVNPNRAFFYSGIERIKTENQITEIERVNGIPSFSYETSLVITAWYEDSYSLSDKLETYRDMGIKAVGFWSIGQETPDVWRLLTVE
jgi:hypothetical protein